VNRFEYALAMVAFALLLLTNTVLLVNMYEEKHSDKLECYDELQDLMQREKDFHGGKIWH
jgi:hypothetical protein|tara:strand:- start:301 stop:480 length:180 start_codon:yes stop_codon:yes gene_type:complete